jgi:hypothetical protein
MNVPNYITTLLQPTASRPTGRKVWSIDLETVWIPFFLATNTVKATAIPSEALGAPLRLAYDKDSEVKFTKSGRPSLKVTTEVAASVRMVRENFVANLQSFTGKVMSQEKDAYKAEVEAAQAAASPIVAKMKDDLDMAYLRLQETASAEKAETPTETEKEPVAA